ncbi:MAG: transcriptional regulator [Solirubrobacteraceae bacterium]
MASKRNRSGAEIRLERPVNERRVATYMRLMDAEELVAQARYEHGASDEEIMDAYERSEPETATFESEDELYLVTLGRYVAALGGVLEVRAVFPECSVVVLREPDTENGQP